ncbi:MAG: hypothetical protein ACOY3P_00305 [Planctomycetota bacterium]
MLLSLLAYYEFTGRKDVLAAVERAVKLTIRQFGPEQRYFDNPGQKGSGTSHGLMFLDALEWLERLTGDEEYRRAALSLYADYSESTVVNDPDAQLSRLLDREAPLGGHGPDVMGFLRVPLLCYTLSGEATYRQAWENFVEKVERHLGVGGSPLSGHGEEIKQEGQTPDMPYPFTFDIEFSIETDQAVEFPLRLRVPAWSGEPTVTSAGASVSRDEQGFLVVRKEWKTGDRVKLSLKLSIHGRPAAGGTIAVAYGPLVFSLPIPERAEIVQRFSDAEATGLEGFFGYQYDAADLAAARRPLKLEAGNPNFGFKVVEVKSSDPRYPWDRSPLELRGAMIDADGKPEEVVLLPMGCTLLRRTCFVKAKRASVKRGQNYLRLPVFPK